MRIVNAFAAGAYSAPPDPISGFGGRVRVGREGMEMAREGNGMEGERESGGEGEVCRFCCSVFLVLSHMMHHSITCQLTLCMWPMFAF